MNLRFKYYKLDIITALFLFSCSAIKRTETAVITIAKSSKISNFSVPTRYILGNADISSSKTEN